MPVHHALHEGDALALDGVRDDEGGPALGGVRLFHGAEAGSAVVPVDGDDVPVEGLELFAKRLDVHHVLYESVDLGLVVVQDGDQVVEPVLGRAHQRFPDLALLHLAVAEQAVEDRKSTRLNSSHVKSSYAVFCLKKKKKN